MKNLWTAKDLAEHFKISVDKVYTFSSRYFRGLSKDDELPPPIKIGTLVRWSEEAVEQWVKEKHAA